MSARTEKRIMQALAEAGANGLTFTEVGGLGTRGQILHSLAALFASGAIVRTGQKGGKNGVIYLPEHCPPRPKCGECGSGAVIKKSAGRLLCRACGALKKPLKTRPGVVQGELPRGAVILSDIADELGLTPAAVRERIKKRGVKTRKMLIRFNDENGGVYRRSVVVIGARGVRKLRAEAPPRQPKKTDPMMTDYPPRHLIAEARALKARGTIPAITPEALVMAMHITRNLARAIADAARA